MARITARVQDVDRVYINVAEADKYLGGCSRPTQRELRDSGELPYYIIGRRILYKLSDLDKFIEKHRVPTFSSKKK